jgi:hypothetical protein
VIPIPEKLKNIPPNTLCYGGPSQILALSILTNRIINVYGHYPSEMLAENISEADFRSFLNEKKTNISYVWKRESIQEVPLSIYLRHSHFSLLVPLSDSHFSITYNYIAPMDSHFVNKKIQEDVSIFDEEPAAINLESSDDDGCVLMDVDVF